LLDESKRLREAAKTERAVKVEPTAAPMIAAPAPQASTAPSPALSKAAGQNLKKKLLAVEAQVAQLQAEQTSLHTQLSQALPPADLAAAAKRLKLIDAQLAQAEEEWMTLGETLEA
jgi:ATP-binding cassette, subfamily F, member 3